MKITRARLYDLVWSGPMGQVAADLNISAPVLSRLCSDYDIPCPPQGYWRRSLARRADIQRPPLSSSEFGTNQTIDISNQTQMKGKQKRLSPEERHKQLLDTARQIIVDDGLAACTIAHVADRAGVSEGLAFRYCRSRDDMLADLAKREWIDQAKVWAKEVAKGQSLEERVRLFVQTYLAQTEERGAVLRRLMEVPGVNRQLQDMVDVQIDRLNPRTAGRVADQTRWSETESYWKTLALTAAHRRSSDLLVSGRGTLDQCVRTALVFSGYSTTS